MNRTEHLLSCLAEADALLERVKKLEAAIVAMDKANASADRAYNECLVQLTDANAVIEEAEGALEVFAQDFIRYGSQRYAVKALTRIREWKEGGK